MDLSLSSFIEQASRLPPNGELLFQQGEQGIRVIESAMTNVASLAHRLSKAALYVLGRSSEVSPPLFGGYASLPIRPSATFRPVLNYLEEHLGKQRFERALRSIGLNYVELNWRGFGLTKNELATLFQAVTFIHAQDVEELLAELQQEAPSIRAISGERLLQLQVRCRGRTKVEECSKEILDELFGLLQPCITIEEMMVGARYDDSLSVRSVLAARPFERSGVAYHTLSHKAYLTEEEWATIFLKRLTSNPLPQGLIVRSPNGYLKVTHVIETSGASKIFLKSLDRERVHSKVVYRGTRGALISPDFVDSFLSIREDLTRQMGSNGIMETFEATKRVLSDPGAGFVADPEEIVDMYGYSLGGVHAMRDCLLFEKRVHRLFTLCSPGIDRESTRLFAEKMRQRAIDRPLDITHLVDVEDFCPTMGEALIGEGCQGTPLRVRVICQVPLSKEPYVFPKSHPEVEHASLKDVTALIATVGKGILAHVRVTPYEPYQFHILSNQEPEILEKYLSHDPEYFDGFFEKIRSTILLANIPFSEFARAATN